MAFELGDVLNPKKLQANAPWIITGMVAAGILIYLWQSKIIVSAIQNVANATGTETITMKSPTAAMSYEYPNSAYSIGACSGCTGEYPDEAFERTYY